LTNYFDIKLSDENIGKISNLGLAHLGDAVYELMVRVWLCEHGKCTSGGLHRAAVSYVNAPRQARMAEKLMPLLTEEEQAVYKRGRNTKVNSIPKNANPGEYHAATGLEALLGYLYLHGRQERINELFKIMMED
jgi:ribonuclease-3 family protein